MSGSTTCLADVVMHVIIVKWTRTIRQSLTRSNTRRREYLRFSGFGAGCGGKNGRFRSFAFTGGYTPVPSQGYFRLSPVDPRRSATCTTPAIRCHGGYSFLSEEASSQMTALDNKIRMYAISNNPRGHTTMGGLNHVWYFFMQCVRL